MNASLNFSIIREVSYVPTYSKTQSKWLDHESYLEILLEFPVDLSALYAVHQIQLPDEVIRIGYLPR